MTVFTDEEIKQSVLDELSCEPMIAKDAIGVAVHNGIVTLNGKVGSYSKKLTAEKAAQRVAGVKAVAEEIVVDVPNAFRKTDADIAEAALTALQWDTIVPDDRVKVKVENGWITLSGNLDWGFQKAAAEKAVHNLQGVHGVANLIATKPHASSSEVKKEISRLFHQKIERDLSRIEIETQDGSVRLRGSVSSWTEKHDATRAAWNIPGVSKVENYIAVTG